MRLKRVGVMAQCCSKVNLVSSPDIKGSMIYVTITFEYEEGSPHLIGQF